MAYRKIMKGDKFLFWGLLAGGFLFMPFVYFFENSSGSMEISQSLVQREIETPFKLFFNGYIGYWFRFKTLGNFNWLILPVVGACLPGFKTWSNAEKFFMFVYFMLCLFISFLGFYNYRYGFTLVPLNLFIYYYGLKRIFPLRIGNRLVDFLAFLPLILILLNHLIFSFLVSENPPAKTVFSRSEKAKTISKEGNILQGISRKLVKQNNSQGWINFINALPKHENFLVLNLPEFYYYTSKFGYFYDNREDLLFLENQKVHLEKGLTNEDVFSLLTLKLNVKYIFCKSNQAGLSPKFFRFCEDFGKVIYNFNGYLILSLDGRKHAVMPEQQSPSQQD